MYQNKKQKNKNREIDSVYATPQKRMSMLHFRCVLIFDFDQTVNFEALIISASFSLKFVLEMTALSIRRKDF